MHEAMSSDFQMTQLPPISNPISGALQLTNAPVSLTKPISPPQASSPSSGLPTAGIHGVCPACEDLDVIIPCKDLHLTITCRACSRSFHCTCVRVTAAAAAALVNRWTCVECRWLKQSSSSKLARAPSDPTSTPRPQPSPAPPLPNAPIHSLLAAIPSHLLCTTTNATSAATLPVSSSSTDLPHPWLHPPHNASPSPHPTNTTCALSLPDTPWPLPLPPGCPPPALTQPSTIPPDSLGPAHATLQRSHSLDAAPDMPTLPSASCPQALQLCDRIAPAQQQHLQVPSSGPPLATDPSPEAPSHPPPPPPLPSPNRSLPIPHRPTPLTIPKPVLSSAGGTSQLGNCNSLSFLRSVSNPASLDVLAALSGLFFSSLSNTRQEGNPPMHPPPLATQSTSFIPDSATFTPATVAANAVDPDKFTSASCPLMPALEPSAMPTCPTPHISGPPPVPSTTPVTVPVSMPTPWEILTHLASSLLTHTSSHPSCPNALPSSSLPVPSSLPDHSWGLPLPSSQPPGCFPASTPFPSSSTTPSPVSDALLLPKPLSLSRLAPQPQPTLSLFQSPVHAAPPLAVADTHTEPMTEVEADAEAGSRSPAELESEVTNALASCSGSRLIHGHESSTSRVESRCESGSGCGSGSGSASRKRVRWAPSLYSVQFIPHRSNSRSYWFAPQPPSSSSSPPHSPPTTPTPQKASSSPEAVSVCVPPAPLSNLQQPSVNSSATATAPPEQLQSVSHTLTQPAVTSLHPQPLASTGRPPEASVTGRTGDTSVTSVTQGTQHLHTSASAAARAPASGTHTMSESAAHSRSGSAKHTGSESGAHTTAGSGTNTKSESGAPSNPACSDEGTDIPHPSKRRRCCSDGHTQEEEKPVTVHLPADACGAGPAGQADVAPATATLAVACSLCRSADSVSTGSCGTGAESGAALPHGTGLGKVLSGSGVGPHATCAAASSNDSRTAVGTEDGQAVPSVHCPKDGQAVLSVHCSAEADASSAAACGMDVDVAPAVPVSSSSSAVDAQSTSACGMDVDVTPAAPVSSQVDAQASQHLAVGRAVGASVDISSGPTPSAATTIASVCGGYGGDGCATAVAAAAGGGNGGSVAATAAAGGTGRCTGSVGTAATAAPDITAVSSAVPIMHLTLSSAQLCALVSSGAGGGSTAAPQQYWSPSRTAALKLPHLKTSNMSHAGGIFGSPLTGCSSPLDQRRPVEVGVGVGAGRELDLDCIALEAKRTRVHSPMLKAS